MAQHFSPVIYCCWPIPLASRSKVCGRSPAEIMDSTPVGDMEVFCECSVLSGRGLCVELIIRLEETYIVYFVQ